MKDAYGTEHTTMGELRALVASLADVPDEIPVLILFDSDAAESTAIESYGVQPRTATDPTPELVLSISLGQ